MVQTISRSERRVYSHYSKAHRTLRTPRDFIQTLTVPDFPINRLFK